MARLGRLGLPKNADLVPALEIETAAPASGRASTKLSSAASAKSDFQDDYIPDSVKLTELLQRATGEPKQAKWQLELARQYLVMEQPLLAEQSATKAIGIDQRCGEAWALRGDLAERRADWGSALRYYQQALSTVGEQADWQSRVAHCYEELGEHRRALSALERAEELYPTGQVPSELRIRHGRLLADLRQYRRAIAELQQVTSESSQDLTAWLLLSEIQALSGDASGARITLARAKELFPQNATLTQREQSLTALEETLAIAR